MTKRIEERRSWGVFAPLKSAAAPLAGLAMGLAVAMSASGQTVSAGNPMLERFNQAITFYASFDGYAAADLSVGKNVPVGNAQNLEWSEGLIGQALHGRKNNLIFESTDNIDLGHGGTLVLWVKPGEWQDDENPHQIGWLHIHNSGQSLYLARQGGKANGQALMAIYGPNANDPATRALIKNGSSENWQPGQWHMLAISWSSGTVELSVDGGVFTRGTAPQSSEQADAKPANRPDVMNFAAGGSPQTPCLMDELVIVNRPLDNEEVKWIYESMRPAPVAAADQP